MSVSVLTPQRFYSSPGLMTDPGDFATCFDNLPTDIPSLVKTVQGTMLHIF